MSPYTVAWERLTESRKVSQRPCLFYGVILSETSTSAKEIVVYDGESTNGKRFHQFACPGKATTPFIFQYPVKFERGLYVDIGSIEEVTVLWQPLKL